MESNDLRIFQTVAYEKSISKAALKMGYVQSNITLRIKALEVELGTQLLLRHNKGVSLTQSGEKLLVYADQIIKLLNEAENSFKDNNSIKALRIGATQTISASLVPKWLTRYSKKYPEVSMSLKTDSQKNLIEQVTNGELDGIFSYVQCVQNNLSTVFTFTEEVAIISSLNIKKVKEMIDSPLIISGNIDCPYGVILKKWIFSNYGTINGIIQLDSLEAIVKCVEDGMGISLLPINIIKENNKVNIHELPSELKKLYIYFIKGNTLLNKSHPINDFINVFSKEEIYYNL